MVWTLEDYPVSMKNLPHVIRKKAIDIANSMIDEGYKEEDAIPIAINQAKEWHENRSEEEVEHYRKHGKVTTRSSEGKERNSNPERLEEGQIVKTHEDGWAVQSEGSDRASNIYSTKSEAIKRAKEIAKNKATSVTIYKKDGTMQEEVYYNE